VADQSPRYSLKARFPRAAAGRLETSCCGRLASFCTAGFAGSVGGLLLFKCLGEIIPSIGTSAMPATATGSYTIVDQALDLGLLVPLFILVGILLLKRLSASTLNSP
jgi:hypothetical protein